MFKLIALVLGLVVGFSAGMYYGVHHPSDAARLSDAQKQEVHDQIQAMREKIHQLAAKAQGNGGIAGTGIGANLTGNNNAAPATDPDLGELDQKAQKQLDLLKAKLSN